MEISVVPDPQHPNGGHAILRFRSEAPPTSVELAIRDLRKDIWLSGGGWQNEQTTLGIHDAGDAGNGWSQIPLGPGIVDRIPEDAYLEFHLGSETGWFIWPDSILCSPSAVGHGTIGVKDADLASNLSGGRPSVQAAPPPPPEQQAPVLDEPSPIDAEPKPESPTESRKSAGFLWILMLLALAAAIAIGAIYLMSTQRETEPESVATTDCSEAGFAGRIEEPNDAQFEALVECGDELEEATAYRILDRLVVSGHGPALFVYGQLYDASAEVDLPFAFSSNPAIAAEYYARALAAGHAAAEEPLERVCSTLSLENELHAMARETHCQQEDGQ